MRWIWVCMGGGTTPASTSASVAAAAAGGGGGGSCCCEEMYVAHRSWEVAAASSGSVCGVQGSYRKRKSKSRQRSKTRGTGVCSVSSEWIRSLLALNQPNAERRSSHQLPADKVAAVVAVVAAV
jgi:hypothetical protein